jgi:glycosyltransferase involved in cell wall biosynthesis
MDKKRVFLIAPRTIDHDPRRPKEVDAIEQGGYAVTLLSWDRDCKTLDSEQIGDAERYYDEIRVRLKAPWSIKVLPFLPIWWSFEFFWLINTKWDVVHVINFHSIIPALIAGKLKRKPVIYEILDTYEDAMVLPNSIRYLLILVDKVFMRLASAVIIADEAQVEEFDGIPNSKVIPVYDSPPDFSKESNVKANNVFTLFYAGVLYKNRRLNLDKVVSAISGIDNVKLIIAGYGDQVEEVETWSRAMPDKIQFIGKISPDDALKGSIAADLLFELRDPTVPQYKYICGSKFLRAMSCGKAVLVNKDTSAAIKVYENNCGLVMDANNIEEIKEAIIKLSDNLELCNELGANARKAYEERYSWGIMEKRLLALYRELTGEIGEVRVRR